MHVVLTDASVLSEALCHQWRKLRAGAACYASPFFDPEFYKLAARHLPGIEVAVMHRGGNVVGFFPFERGAMGTARPGAGIASDYHAPVVAAGVAWSASRLLRACGLSTWDYWAVPVLLPGMSMYHRHFEEAYAVDLSRPVHWHRALPRKARKLEREHGPLRFVPHDRSESALRALVRWKTDHYARTGAENLLAHPGVMDFLQELIHTDRHGFAGQFSVLYAGDRPVAANLGMRSGTWLHWWFASYDTGFAIYSPGQLLLREMVASAQAAGMERLDFGPGGEQFKREIGNTSMVIARGSIEIPSLIVGGRALRRQMSRITRGTGVHRHVTGVLGRLRQAARLS
jgi:CelD/BcsL family acetyltransferase involved in cellulose biosynthesis